MASSLKPYKDESPCSRLRRFVACIIDALIIVLVHGIIFGVSANIISQTDIYKPRQKVLETEMIECYKIQEEAHIYEYIGEGDKKYETPQSQETMFKTWAYQHILASFNNDSSKFIEEGITELKLPEGTIEATYDSDRIAYFYVNFCANKNDKYKVVDFGGLLPKPYYYSVLKKHSFTYNDEPLWNYDETNYTLPLLKGKFAVPLYKYLFVDESYQLGLSCYNLLVKSWQNIWNEEVKLLINCEGYKAHYDVYASKYGELSYIINAVSLISYVVAFLLAYVLPVILFKKHQTIGRTIQKMASVDVEGYPNLPWQIIVRSLLEFFGFFGFTIISNFINLGSNSAFVYPLFKIGNNGISMMAINFAFLVIALLSLIISCFTRRKSTVPDLCTNSYLIDLRYFIDHTHADIIINNIDDSKEKVSEPDTLDVEIIDSSTIRKD